MSIIILLIAVSLVLALGFLAAFIWSVKDGQYEDDYTPSVRMLFDNETIQTTDIKEKIINTENLLNKDL
jgi:cbb3-type cytochrome oxidase maturation protein